MEWWGLLRFRNLLYLMCYVLIELVIKYWKERGRKREEKKENEYKCFFRQSMHFGSWKWQMWLNMESFSTVFIHVQEAYKSDETIFFFEDNIVFKLCWVRPYQKTRGGISFMVPDFEHTSLFPVPPLYVCLCRVTRVSGQQPHENTILELRSYGFIFISISVLICPFLCPI